MEDGAEAGGRSGRDQAALKLCSVGSPLLNTAPAGQARAGWERRASLLARFQELKS